jgi:hypothetical protein
MNGHNTRAPTKDENLINEFLQNVNLNVHHGLWLFLSSGKTQIAR